MTGSSLAAPSPRPPQEGQPSKARGGKRQNPQPELPLTDSSHTEAANDPAGPVLSPPHAGPLAGKAHGSETPLDTLLITGGAERVGVGRGNP